MSLVPPTDGSLLHSRFIGIPTAKGLRLLSFDCLLLHCENMRSEGSSIHFLTGGQHLPTGVWHRATGKCLPCTRQRNWNVSRISSRHSSVIMTCCSSSGYRFSSSLPFSSRWKQSRFLLMQSSEVAATFNVLFLLSLAAFQASAALILGSNGRAGPCSLTATLLA
ncbi:hypothetical protein R1flu_012173 [Riccia fluitans]|uniref:Uncharacterized protein n=1 Tax=Riccia fluitans TaxID=41844 RepID=A0ABD1Z9W5_9MARC